MDGAQAVFRMVGVFSMVMVFWALFFQYGSSWVLQAERMNLHVGGMKLEASQLSSMNSIFVLLLVPAFTYGLYPALERRGIRVTDLRKMSVGMFLTCASFLAAAAVESRIAAGPPPSALWQVVQYLLLSAAEVLVSVTGLEFAYTQAPPSMKSTLMSFWFAAIALGNLLTAWVARLNPFRGTALFLFFAGLMLVAAVVFVRIARRYPAVPFRAMEGELAPEGANR